MTFKARGILSRPGKVAMIDGSSGYPITISAGMCSHSCQEGMDEMDALRSITINAAEITGIDDRVGSLEQGKDADIVIFDGHPLDFRTRAVWVFIDGYAVKKTGIGYG